MNTAQLSGKRVLITAGPTREAIDPVRYISNHSSGKMGYAIAAECLNAGAEVTIISGPVSVHLEHSNLRVVKVTSASEMYLACCRYFEETDVAIFAAAVADYRPAKVAAQKIKKDDAAFTIQMVKNIDIATEFGKVKQSHQLSIGFALETNDELHNAMNKLKRKNFDLVVLNSMNDSNATFGHDTNKITTVRRDLSQTVYPLKDKRKVAEDIVFEISNLLAIRELAAVSEAVYNYETMYQ